MSYCSLLLATNLAMVLQFFWRPSASVGRQLGFRQSLLDFEKGLRRVGKRKRGQGRAGEERGGSGTHV